MSQTVEHHHNHLCNFDLSKSLSKIYICINGGRTLSWAKWVAHPLCPLRCPSKWSNLPLTKHVNEALLLPFWKRRRRRYRTRLLIRMKIKCLGKNHQHSYDLIFSWGVPSDLFRKRHHLKNFPNLNISAKIPDENFSLDIDYDIHRIAKREPENWWSF